MTSPIDELLARARLRREPYTRADIDAALARLAARAAVRRDASEEPCDLMPHTRNACGSADADAVDAESAADADGVGEGALGGDPGTRKASDELPADECPPNRGQAREGSVDESSAADDLQTLCETVITHTGALTDLRIFLARALPEPSGARVLGCMLQLSEREESARFWWQYAAGAGDPAASYCLYLHHRALGEHGAADWWHTQHTQTDVVADAETGPEVEITTTLRILRALKPDDSPVPEPVNAVLHYVPVAVAFVDDDLDLPLPDPDFTDRIRALTTLTSTAPTSSAPTAPVAGGSAEAPRRARKRKPLPERRRPRRTATGST
ncbi:hypothetical protein GCM10010306_055120 [Streptomyces umbrinus]|uniref:hypothetical protein n=1 Tax=Streptomyces umbrinus TaxID=67370 RepID=UPI0016761818|nr:hypothetical protein [Streptomyces umbrinus]GHB54402.1 hypothetical protein GCM10010306_055120 [Streptomyces umbrinus]